MLKNSNVDPHVSSKSANDVIFGAKIKILDLVDDVWEYKDQRD